MSGLIDNELIDRKPGFTKKDQLLDNKIIKNY